MVVETMHREKLSHKEVERQFAITSHSCVPNWERIYLTEGPEGLYVERRGHGSKGRLSVLKNKVLLFLCVCSILILIDVQKNKEGEKNPMYQKYG